MHEKKVAGEHMARAKKKIDSKNVQIKALIIDLDGTLVDSTNSVLQMYNTVFADFGLEPPHENKVRALFGRTTREFINTLAPELSDDKKKAMFEALRKATIEVVPLIKKGELCGHIPKFAEKYKLAVVTNRGENSTNIILEKFDIRKYFDLVVSAVLHEPKPSPDMLFYVLKQFGISPEEAVFLGDRDVDAMAGARAGVRTLLVPLGKKAIDELLG